MKKVLRQETSVDSKLRRLAESGIDVASALEAEQRENLDNITLCIVSSERTTPDLEVDICQIRDAADCVDHSLVYVCPPVGYDDEEQVKLHAAQGMDWKRRASKHDIWALACSEMDEVSANSWDGTERYSHLRRLGEIVHCDALIVLEHPDFTCEYNSYFKFAQILMMPIFDVSGSTVQSWDYTSGSFADFCNKDGMFENIRQNLLSYDGSWIC